MSLSAARGRPEPGLLRSGDVIPLDRAGRNPEVEEVLGALSLLLNGGGVAQLKTIDAGAQPGPRGPRGLGPLGAAARSGSWSTQLDDNKADIVHAIDSLNTLALSVRKQQGSIDARARGAAQRAAARSTSSAATWSRCSGRSTGSATSASG